MKYNILMGLTFAFSVTAIAQGLVFWTVPSQRSDRDLILEVAEICKDYEPSRDYSQNSEMYERYNKVSLLCERIARLERQPHWTRE